MAKYVFDSNIFINLQRRQPIDIYPSLWSKIGDLMENGTIISSQEVYLSLIHISEPTRQAEISYAVFCLKKKKNILQQKIKKKKNNKHRRQDNGENIR